MRKMLIGILALVLSFAWVFPGVAAESNVLYDGDAEKFIFLPGSEESPTDLFSAFKDVMPGDRIVQQITVKNDTKHNKKVKIYLRSLGAVEDAEFLSKLKLQVKKSATNEMDFMFDASADQTAQLTDWVYLGTLYSGGRVNLDVILEVPVELDNRYSSRLGTLDWEFKVEGFEIEPTDPEPDNPGTDARAILPWCAGGLLALSGVLWISLRRKQRV